MPPPVFDCYAITPPGVEALIATNGGLRVRVLAGTVPAA